MSDAQTPNAGEELELETLELSDADISNAEISVLSSMLEDANLSDGRMTEAFEDAFARYTGRDYAIAFNSPGMALYVLMQALGYGESDEVICGPYSWYQTPNAIALAGAKPVFSDIDYWSHCLSPKKAADKVTENTRAIMVNNANGQPADWDKFQELAKEKGLFLIEDSSEAIGSIYRGKKVGSFGDASLFAFAQPGPLVCGEGAMIVTDDKELYIKMRHMRKREDGDDFSVVITGTLPYNCGMHNLTAALGLVQLKRIDSILESRKKIEALYADAIQFFEGIKPPYTADGVEEIHWFTYSVHLGTRFTASARNAILEDLHENGIEARDFCRPTYIQQYFVERGIRKGECGVCEKVADRSVALPFHAGLDKDRIDFIIETLKDAATNTGAGAAIYL